MKISRATLQTLFLLGLWLGLGLQAHAQADTVTYVYTDPQGTPLVEADAQGNIIARYDYTPYGRMVTSLGNPPNGPGYTGHVNDPETGLVYMQQRYYQPDARFLSPDPVGPTPGDGYNFSRYAYASNNPISNIDPDGRSDESNGCDIECKREKQEQRERRNDSPYTGGDVKQFFVGVFKRVLNELPKDAGQEDFTSSNNSQAAGMMAGSVLLGAVATVVTDGEVPEADLDATAPVGRLGSPMGVRPGTNRPGSVDGLQYSGHAFDQMQGRGLTPSVVRNTIDRGISSPGRNGATIHHDRTNNITVITNSSGRVITAYPGGG
ncbi:MAG TPA: RHS repeat-associated core domain-containing protein [Frateuria sp.]|uniref:RHS repeat-associated core domain-containing protein n=1 Tax=Frateuria sp. TaxID=2211372 RepID=UPI002DF1E654|nr:RHS repeat-associated core domain-containing protein [Frateuria sp.]